MLEEVLPEYTKAQRNVNSAHALQCDILCPWILKFLKAEITDKKSGRTLVRGVSS